MMNATVLTSLARIFAPVAPIWYTELKCACKQHQKAIVYCRKEGRALGEMTKFLVCNARKRQEGGDRADAYFACTECVAGVEDMRFQ